ncbi:MAG: PQQ-dependent sugar dehydrogenase, partial [Solirubrobacterales bacterium]
MLASCSGSDGDSSGEPQVESAPAPQETGELPKSGVVARNLEAPWSIAFHVGTPLVSERDSARILELGDQGEPREVANIQGVTPLGEAGLLGITVRDGYLYTYFTASGENRIERRKIEGQPGSLELGAAETILGGIPASSIHNGGRIAFGPDGMLYATAGDAGDESNSQDRDSLGGKILRMTPDGKVPADNPFEDSFIYSYGHRNPQGIAWSGGKMYASEFGQDTWDELNVIEAGGNYGWPEVEGKAGEKGFIDPVQQWSPTEASPSGIATSGNYIYIA